DVDDREHRRAVEDPLGAPRPHRDPLSPFTPDEEDEVGDRQQEGDSGDDQQRRQGLLELKDDDQARDRREDQEAPECRVDAGEEPAHVAVKYARTASAPATKVAPVNHARRPRRSAGAYSHGARTASSESVPYR